MAKICGIYKITSPSGRVYIGESSNIKNRFSSYKHLRCKEQVRVYKSFIKYGVENHVFEIIEECDFKNLLIRERYWQDYYNVLEEGLNCKLTPINGEKTIVSEETKKKLATWKGKKHSPESIHKMSLAQKGRKLSKEQIEKLRAVNKNRPVSEETRKKLSLANKGKKRSIKYIEILQKRVRKRIICIFIKEHKIIKFQSVTECAEYFNISCGGVVNYLKNKNGIMSKYNCELEYENANNNYNSFNDYLNKYK